MTADSAPFQCQVVCERAPLRKQKCGHPKHVHPGTPAPTIPSWDSVKAKDGGRKPKAGLDHKWATPPAGERSGYRGERGGQRHLHSAPMSPTRGHFRGAARAAGTRRCPAPAGVQPAGWNSNSSSNNNNYNNVHSAGSSPLE